MNNFNEFFWEDLEENLVDVTKVFRYVNKDLWFSETKFSWYNLNYCLIQSNLIRKNYLWLHETNSLVVSTKISANHTLSKLFAQYN